MEEAVAWFPSGAAFQRAVSKSAAPKAKTHVHGVQAESMGAFLPTAALPTETPVSVTARRRMYEAAVRQLDSGVLTVVGETHESAFRSAAEYFAYCMAQRSAKSVAVAPAFGEQLASVPTAVLFAGEWFYVMRFNARACVCAGVSAARRHRS
jgi:hypothetical protein